MQILSVLRPRFLGETPQSHFSSEPLHILFTDAVIATEQQHSSAGNCIMTDPPLGSASLHSIPGYLKWSATFSSVLLMGQEWFREDRAPRSYGSSPVDLFATLLLLICHPPVMTLWKTSLSVPSTQGLWPHPPWLPTTHKMHSLYPVVCLSLIYTRFFFSSQLPQQLSEWTAKIHCSLITQSGEYLRGLVHLISTTTYHVRSLWMAFDL